MRAKLLGSSFLAAGLVGVVTAVASPRGADTRTTMQGLYQALSDVLVASLDAREFQDPANREEILLSLRLLSANASRLEAHSELAPSYDYVRRSLARDCRDAAERFERNEYVGTQFVLHKLVDNCVTCHAKLPEGARLRTENNFLENERIATLPPEERVRLEIATRHFDRATETCEAIMLSPKAIADNLMLSGIFEEYFKLTLRVERNVQRAISTLQTFATRTGTPGYPGGLMAAWIDALQKVEPTRSRGNELSRARDLLREAREAQRFPADRRGLVYFVEVSSLLYEYLDTEPSEKAALSEAYYLLGVAESHITRSYWVSETDFFLERAVRLAPRSPSAREAYDLLEAYTSAAFSGSAGLRIPPDVAANLEELKKLIE